MRRTGSIVVFLALLLDNAQGATAAAALGGGVLTYGDRGRAQSGAAVATQLSAQCVAAERALVLTALTPSDRLPVAGTSALMTSRYR